MGGHLKIIYDGVVIFDETDALEVDLDHSIDGDVKLSAKFPAKTVEMH